MLLTAGLPAEPSPDDVYELFSDWAADQGLALYPAQEEALIEMVSGANVILATPTGSGKSLVAAGAHLPRWRTAGGRSTPRRSRRWCRRSSSPCATCSAPSNVGMLTGDAAVNADAPIICCTAEILANIALREGAGADVGQVVMDEFHFYADPDRGWAWQVPLLELPDAQFLLMSATLGDVTLLRRRPDPRAPAGRPRWSPSAERPVPLHLLLRH